MTAGEPQAEWVVVRENDQDGQVDTALALLQEEGIESRLTDDCIEVPSALENDALAVLAALDEPPEDPGPDQAAQFASCTARVNGEPMVGVDAQMAAMALVARGIPATSDAPGGIGGSEVCVLPECYVLVSPDDLERARALVDPANQAELNSALRDAATEIVVTGVEQQHAAALQKTLGTRGIASVVVPVEGDGAESGMTEVRVRPRDGGSAQETVRQIAEAAQAEPAPDAARGAESDSAETSLQASIVVFVLLALIAFFVMRSCA